MKTIKKQITIEDKPIIEYKRVKNDNADRMVKHDSWTYCKKVEWKEKVRDFGKPKNQKKIEIKKEPIQKIIESKPLSKYQAKKVNQEVMSEEAKQILEKTILPKPPKKQKKELKKN